MNPSFTRGSSLERSQRRGFQLSDYYSKLVEQLRSSKTLKVTSLLRGLIPLFFRVNNSTFQRRFLRNLLGLNFFLNLSGPTGHRSVAPVDKRRSYLFPPSYSEGVSGARRSRDRARASWTCTELSCKFIFQRATGSPGAASREAPLG